MGKKSTNHEENILYFRFCMNPFFKSLGEIKCNLMQRSTKLFYIHIWLGFDGDRRRRQGHVINMFGWMKKSNVKQASRAEILIQAGEDVSKA